ncbi:hypothetical protein AAGS40_22600 [Paraburkholderia sp. PREW-6R]|uniref:hypothetical protein n=1 Tax=Paraburkholderia sp. PREW-6R TaxID=3141544 RepID=UPI0031F508DC
MSFLDLWTESPVPLALTRHRSQTEAAQAVLLQHDWRRRSGIADCVTEQRSAVEFGLALIQREPCANRESVVLSPEAVLPLKFSVVVEFVVTTHFSHPDLFVLEIKQP